MNTNQDKLTLLRNRAETVLKQSVVTLPISAQDIDEVLHELHVHHIELEIQFEDLQQAYRTIESAHRRYANLFDFAPVGYIVTDMQGMVINANLTASTMLGLKREILEKRSFSDFITPDFQDIYHLYRRAVHSTQEAQACEVQLQRADGTLFYAQLNTDLLDSHSKTLRTAITNISTIKEAEEALRGALAHEKELSDLRTRVLSVIAHEFRTPLTVILSAVETLDHYGDRLTDESKHQRYETIRNFVWYLNDTVQDASTISVIDGRPSLKQVSFDVIAFIHQLINDMGTMTKEGQKITLSIAAQDEEEMVSWDRNLARRIIMNLLNNALKYSTEPVRCHVECEQALVRLSIEDQGAGISEEDQQHIYDLFYRGENAELMPGTGIGLYIAQQAVQAHGGTIRCESRLGTGTTFILELPRQASARLG